MISLIELMGTTQKMKFSIKDFLSNLVTFTEEIFNGKLNFLCSGNIGTRKNYSALEDNFKACFACFIYVLYQGDKR